MASYTIRIELKAQSEKKRTRLMCTMLENGFSRSVVCSKGFTYALPTDEFVYVGPENVTVLMERITDLLGSFTEEPTILITRSAERGWSGLRVINLE